MIKNEITVTELLQKQQLQLDRIERAAFAQKNVLTFEEFCSFAGISKSYGYKLTSQAKVPFYKPNQKMIYFERSQVESWLLQNPIKTNAEIEKEAASYMLKKGGNHV